MLKILLIILGSLFLGLGIVGIVVPGLPTTPFLLLSASCYLRSSEKLYNWIAGHSVFGKYIRLYYEQKAVTKKTKITAMMMMWTMIAFSIVFFLNSLILKLVVFSAGIIGTIVVLRLKTYKGN